MEKLNKKLSLPLQKNVSILMPLSWTIVIIDSINSQQICSFGWFSMEIPLHCQRDSLQHLKILLAAEIKNAAINHILFSFCLHLKARKMKYSHLMIFFMHSTFCSISYVFCIFLYPMKTHLRGNLLHRKIERINKNNYRTVSMIQFFYLLNFPSFCLHKFTERDWLGILTWTNNSMVPRI